MDEDGTSLESTTDGPPPRIVLGRQDVLPALEAELMKMKPDESRRVILPPSRAFGPIHDDRILSVPLKMLHLDVQPEPGMTVEVTEDGAESCPGTIVEVDEDNVIVDCNHPLAGKTLTFNIKFVDFA